MKGVNNVINILKLILIFNRDDEMKRYGHLFEKVVDIKNIKYAIKMASLGKRNHRRVRKYYQNSNRTAMLIHNMLLNNTYRPSHVRERKIKEATKIRTITSAPFFPDQIIHWAIMTVLSPIFMKSMYHFNLATIPGRGGQFGKYYLERWLRNDHKHTKYCLKTDVHHFYPSINHKILKEKLLHRFKDKRLLNVLFKIIDCYNPGLPLGLYSSQWFANFFLEKEDHKIKEVYHAPYYLRYMDDQVILGPNKKKLHKLLKHMQYDMNNIDLEIKPTWQVFPIKSRFIDFLGFRFYRDHTTLRSRNFLAIKRRAKRIYKRGYISPHDAYSMISYWGWIKHSDSYKFYQKYVKCYTSIHRCKEVIQNEKI